MARIKVLEAIAGADFSWAPGDVVEVSEEAAAAWADGQRAVLADDAAAGSGPAPVGGGDRVPRIVDKDGQELEVLDAVVEETSPPDGEDNSLTWSRWTVTVRLPAAPATEAPDPEPADVTDLENQGPADDQEDAEVLFDPNEHSNREVLAYLSGVGEQEALRVLDAEAAGQNRSGIAKNRDQVLETARARDTAAGTGHGGAEKAADASRGGGRAETPETRSW
ncbi:hypothetical protein JL475_24275 [Streptomyces sp. M2CJ-2]|uniref:hypothetical protein n=1 Tax=Streptomyces sp. M2CJ-2 TaxID=2803948 RepID=UPI001926BD92|nr:hypothetical protein [Streptomyces sp. M2CJ-2]MBL3669052.1 hypothetical protein [Streptomyces sp. M2CJ-2]